MNAADPPIKTAPAGSQLSFKEVLKLAKLFWISKALH